MKLSASDLVDPMVQAAKTSLAQDWGKAKDYAEPEMAKLATSLVDIAALVAKRKVNRRQAKALLDIHKNTTRTVLLTIEGLGLLAVEDAINAALQAVSGTVDKALGFALL